MNVDTCLLAEFLCNFVIVPFFDCVDTFPAATTKVANTVSNTAVNSAVTSEFLDISNVANTTTKGKNSINTNNFLNYYYTNILALLTTINILITYAFNFSELQALKFYTWFLGFAHQSLIEELAHSDLSTLDSTIYHPSDLLIDVFNTFMFGVFFFLTTAYIYTYGLRNVSTNKGLTEGGMFLYAYLDEVEEEIGQLEDMLSYVVYFGVFVLWFYFFNIFASAILLKNLNWLLAVFCFILILGVLVPTSLLTQLGLAFAQYVRGAGRGTSLLFETLLDLLSVSIIIIRFFVQNIRFVFIFVAIFEYYEFINLQASSFNHIILPSITWDKYWAGAYKNWYWYEIVLQVFVQGVSFLYYVGHLTITYIAQLAIYLILSFWVYFFLYTTFTVARTEKYFYFKRHALLIR